jgi:hypothetical protein
MWEEGVSKLKAELIINDVGMIPSIPSHSKATW